MNNALNISGRYNNQYIVGWVTDMIGYTYIEVCVNNNFLGLNVRKKLWTSSIGRTSAENYVQNTPERIKKQYTEAVFEYEKFLESQWELAKVPTIQPGISTNMLAGVLAGLGFIFAIVWMVMTVRSSNVEAEANKPVLVGTEIRRFILVSANPPKHFYVTLKDLQTGDTYERLYVSKHCNNYRPDQIGLEYNVQVQDFRDPKSGAITHRFPNLYQEFC